MVRLGLVSMPPPNNNKFIRNEKAPQSNGQHARGHGSTNLVQYHHLNTCAIVLSHLYRDDRFEAAHVGDAAEPNAAVKMGIHFYRVALLTLQA